MNNQYNIWNKWDPLKTVVLGDTYKPSFYKDIKDKNIKDALLRICDETHEDLDYYESVLKDFGCTVIRPEIDPNDNIMNYVREDGRLTNKNPGGVPKPPLMPRDTQFVIGNNLVYTSNDKGDCWIKLLDQYNNSDVIDIRRQKQISAPCYTVVGRDLYIDLMDSNLPDLHKHKLLKKTKDVRLNYLRVGGHNDGCFHTIKPGAILSLHEIQRYEDTFPGWDVCYLPNQSWDAVEDFMKMKRYVGGKWWVPGEEDNAAFRLFVESWLEDWVGYVEETVFDVNVLVLDEHHVCVNNMNPTVIEFLKKHKMEAIHVPWRHRYFHDGGLHCLTLDLYRESKMQDYFPDRGDVGIIDHGYD